jgi:hypothetical protein
MAEELFEALKKEAPHTNVCKILGMGRSAIQ